MGASNLNQWSDGSMWMRVLDMGSSENQKVTILNMLDIVITDGALSLRQLCARLKCFCIIAFLPSVRRTSSTDI
jgi:hypothetical protein